MDLRESAGGNEGLVDVGWAMTYRQIDADVAAVRRLLEQTIPGVAIEVGATGEGKWVRLPPSPGAAYRWSFWVYPNGERHIYASLVMAGPAVGGDEQDLWYHPFELDAFDGSRARLAQAFESEVRLVVQSRTRIVQRRGALNWTITLDREGPQHGWETIYRFYALRAGWAGPSGDLDSATYLAPRFDVAGDAP